MSAHKSRDRTRMRERLRHRAIAAKERYKILALVGSTMIGGLVGVEEYAQGMGSTFSAFSAFLSFAIMGAVFGIVALGIKVDERYYR